ncbi:N-acetylneuraminate lyase B-like isoform X3 [Tubulanus polymorphus]|uniref:N-acetylneuraminate lyase B-like isoform X3 n=1 Tax=Tubulanus polymorphus TaxID=672921 RepID=UPI003DA29BB2
MEKIHEFRVEGLVAAVFTPFHENGQLNLDLIDKYVDHLHKSQITNIFVCGCTGEGMSLSVDERKLVAKKWISSGREKLDKIIIQVGAHNLEDSKDLAAHAQEIGADAIASLPSLFFKPNTIDDLIDYCKEIANQASDTPFYYYHLPALTGVTFDMEDFFRGARKRIPTLRGVKFSDANFDMVCGVMEMDSMKYGEFEVFCGNDLLYLGAMALGIEWAVGSTYNFMPRVVHRMVEAFNRGDIHQAKLEQRRIQDVIRVRNKYEQLQAGQHATRPTHGKTVAETKEFMPLIGLDMGPPRLPLKPLSNDLREQFRKDLENIGFFTWIQERVSSVSSPVRSPSLDQSSGAPVKKRMLSRGTSLLTSDSDEPSTPPPHDHHGTHELPHSTYTPPHHSSSAESKRTSFEHHGHSNSITLLTE